MYSYSLSYICNYKKTNNFLNLIKEKYFQIKISKMQTNANNFNNNNDEEWKLPNNQATTEFRRKVIGLVIS